MDCWVGSSHFLQIASCNSTQSKLQTLPWQEETSPALASLRQTYCKKMTWWGIHKAAPSTSHPQRLWTTTAISATAPSPRQLFISAATCPSAPISTSTEAVSTQLNILTAFLGQASSTLTMAPACPEHPKPHHEINMPSRGQMVD